MDTGNVLLVDDEPAFQRLCSSWLKEQGLNVASAMDAKEASLKFKEQEIDLVLLDLALPPTFEPEEGLSLLGEFSSVPVIVLTGHGDRELALRAIGLGAWDFLTKPVDPEILKIVIERALKKHRLEEEVQRLRAKLAPSDELGIVGASRHTQELRDIIKRIAPSDINIMILGPSGTGKELAAKAVHRLSKRNNRPFIPVHCGAIPSELLESELFGHLKGSFTGADRDKPGVLDMADGGVLFLDEVGEMSAQMQVKLLRFLQEGTYFPVGGRIEKKADVRVVSATNRDLEKMVKDGTFREDLYYRLKGIIIRTAPLKDRIEDLPVLATSCLKKLGGDKPKRLSNQALAWLLKQPWPGNIRELENLLECAAALSQNREEIGLADVQVAMHGGRTEDASVADEPLSAQVDALEKRLILASLEATGHNQSQTAKRLGISRAGLLKKMKRLKV